MKGKFIVFEGIDGCGKATQLLKVFEWLISSDKYKGYSIVYTKEPTYSSEAGLKLWKMLASSDQRPERRGKLFCKLMVKDRAEHCAKLLEPALRQGCIVLCDRYSYSTFAYQQAQGVSFEAILAEHRKYKILKPDLTLIFDLPSKLALSRIAKARNKRSLFEKAKFLEVVRQHYLKLRRLLPEEKLVIIDATKPVEKVFAQVKAAIERELLH